MFMFYYSQHHVVSKTTRFHSVYRLSKVHCITYLQLCVFTPAKVALKGPATFYRMPFFAGFINDFLKVQGSLNELSFTRKKYRDSYKYISI